MKTPVKPGQRKFLLNMGYSKQEIDNMSRSSAHYIISEEEERRAKEKQIEAYKRYQEETIVRYCIICNEDVHIHHCQEDDFSTYICKDCRQAILKLKGEK